MRSRRRRRPRRWAGSRTPRSLAWSVKRGTNKANVSITDCGFRPRIGVRGDNIPDSGQSCGGTAPAACRLGPTRPDRAKRTQFPAVPGRPGPCGGRQLCKTKPIRRRKWAQWAGHHEGNCAKRTQFACGATNRSSIPLFHRSSPMPIVQDRANPGGAGWAGALGTRGDCAKQSQFPAAPSGTGLGDERQMCKTKPIWSAPNVSQVHYGKQFRNDSA
jgi:hypothetical protein